MVFHMAHAMRAQHTRFHNFLLQETPVQSRGVKHVPHYVTIGLTLKFRVAEVPTGKYLN